MDPQELTNEVLLESILDCTHFVSHEVPNLFKSVKESLPHSDKIFFMNLSKTKMEKMNIMGTSMIKQIQQYMSIISKIVNH